MNSQLLKKNALAILLGSTGFIAIAQKFPAVQQVSLRAPATIKIDGIPTEWGESLQAYNKNVELYYTIANDDENLYLTVQATNPRIIQKLLMAGLVLSVNSTGKKDDANSSSITFPLLSAVNSRHVLIDAGMEPDVFADNSASPRPADSLIALANKTLLANAKEFKIKGIKTIADTIPGVMGDKRPYFRLFTGFYQPGQYIAVDNKDGIKATARFNDKKVLTYELAVPLKYFGLTKDSRQKFFYNIKLNGLMGDNGMPTIGVMITEKRVNGVTVDPNQDLDNSTDFWGEYTLAK